MNRQNWLTLWNDSSERPLSDLRREMDRLFARTEDTLVPACEVKERPNHYLLTVDMPGISKEDVKLEVMDNQLTLTAERRVEKESDGEAGTWYSERRYGTFQRSFALPAGVDADKIEAQHRDGVLKLMIPKAETAKPRQVKISDGATGFFGKFLGSHEARKDGDKVA